MPYIVITLLTIQFRMSGLIFFLRKKTNSILVTSEVFHVSMGPPHHIDVRNSQMKTPLHEACTHGSVDIVSMLLHAGALKDAHRTHSWTPLMYAVSRNHFQVAVLFMQLESNTSIINEVQRLLLRWGRWFALTCHTLRMFATFTCSIFMRVLDLFVAWCSAKLEIW